MKTRKAYAAALLAAGLLSILGCAPAMADTDGFSEEYYRFQNPDEILSGDEAEQLNEQLDEISHNQNFDVTAALVDSLSGESVEAYADNLYDDCDFGYGDERDGVLLLVIFETVWGSIPICFSPASASPLSLSSTRLYLRSAMSSPFFNGGCRENPSCLHRP